MCADNYKLTEATTNVVTVIATNQSWIGTIGKRRGEEVVTAHALYRVRRVQRNSLSFFLSPRSRSRGDVPWVASRIRCRILFYYRKDKHSLIKTME
ncbi:hypothetical protein PUN28_002464 [Cardiocondyla obscurior]|uniref:Uncharacterized protein n=1 Tax=Cardiocondyla obscurior TaxID=286306 RepID=A0AAW2GU96_9HYME